MAGAGWVVGEGKSFLGEIIAFFLGEDKDDLSASVFLGEKTDGLATEGTILGEATDRFATEGAIFWEDTDSFAMEGAFLGDERSRSRERLE